MPLSGTARRKAAKSPRSSNRPGLQEHERRIAKGNEPALQIARLAGLDLGGVVGVGAAVVMLEGGGDVALGGG